MYITREEQARDDSIIGGKTPRYYIGNYVSPARLGEDIKAFSIFGDYDGLKNVTATGLYSSTQGIFVEPSTNIRIRQGRTEDRNYISNAGELVYANAGEAEVRPQYATAEGPLGPGAYYFPNAVEINNITAQEAKEILEYAIQKSEGGSLVPITAQEMAKFLAEKRGIALPENTEGMSR